jgi:hypothetical protein
VGGWPRLWKPPRADQMIANEWTSSSCWNLIKFNVNVIWDSPKRYLCDVEWCHLFKQKLWRNLIDLPPSWLEMVCVGVVKRTWKSHKIAPFHSDLRDDK